MKLLRIGTHGHESPAILAADGSRRDLSALIPDIAGESLSWLNHDTLAALDLGRLPLLDSHARIGPCMARIPNLICIGLNYRRHAEETGNPIPKEPVVFSKATSCINGPYDPVHIPPGAVKMDWEVELGVVIGRETYQIPEKAALDHVFGYFALNDVSEREYQSQRGGQWIKGKSCPTFAPMGPWLVTADEVPDPQNLALSLSVNGVVQQSSSTSDMIFSVAEILSYLSRFMRLVPGDVIATGTPEGVALGRKPPNFLQLGDVMELEIEGLGRQRSDLVATPG